MAEKKTTSSRSTGAKKAYRKAGGSKDPHEHYHGARKHSHVHAGPHHHDEHGRAHSKEK